MIFSTKSEYGVMMLTDLARHYGEGPLSLTEIAEHLGGLPVTVAYLEQIVPSLKDAKLVESVRGAKGGYKLSRPPETIKMGMVIRKLEGGIAVMGCATDGVTVKSCNHEDVCTSQILWIRVRNAIARALDTTTLADLIPGTRQILPLTNLSSGLVAEAQELVLEAASKAGTEAEDSNLDNLTASNLE